MTSLSTPTALAARGGTIRQLVKFGSIGVVSTAAYVALYSLLRGEMPAGIANALSLVVTAVGNTAANRWLTFGVRGRDGLARDHAAGLLALGAALFITSTSLVALNAIRPHHGRMTEIAILVAANAAATLIRFVLLRLAIDRAKGARMSMAPALATLSQSERTRG